MKVRQLSDISIKVTRLTQLITGLRKRGQLDEKIEAGLDTVRARFNTVSILNGAELEDASTRLGYLFTSSANLLEFDRVTAVTNNSGSFKLLFYVLGIRNKER